jgi:hypothetical protein
MMTRVNFGLLLVLLVLSIMPLPFSYVVGSGVTVPPRIPYSIHETGSSSDSNVTFTWTSRWQEVPQEIVNDSSIVGDHIVIHSSWDIPVTSSNITIRFDSNEIVIQNETGNPLVVDYDTYYLLSNVTVDLTLSAVNDSEVLSFEYTNITFGNYFVPNVEFDSPNYNPIRGEIVNISWTCIDLNANDTNYYWVWISRDDSFFMLLALNLTETHYIWNSTGFLHDDYIYRIRAYSLDFTIEVNNTLLCSVTAPPSSYWPGDYADVISPSFQGTGPILVSTTTTTATTTSTTTSITTTPDLSVLILSLGLSGGVLIGIAVLAVLSRRGK